MTCPACGYPEPKPLGRYQPYVDYECATYDCPSCGSRFAPHDATVHERLHAAARSTYSGQHELGEKVAAAFRRGDTDGLRDLLRQSPKYRFVIDSIETLRPGPRLLEVGCSSGYLTSNFIAQGHEILGTDVSFSAISEAMRLFGDHFALSESDAVDAGAPFDAIFHVGTVGCVADPDGFTRRLLGRLRPGGHLLFNAPNVNVCRQRSAVWGCSTPPPDLVVLFHPDYWRRFHDEAKVEITVADMTPTEAVRERVRRLTRGRRALGPLLADSPGERSPGGTHALGAGAAALRSMAGHVVPLMARFIPKYPAEFGVYVRMTRRP